MALKRGLPVCLFLSDVKFLFSSEKAEGVGVQLVRFRNLTTVVDHQAISENQDKQRILSVLCT